MDRLPKETQSEDDKILDANQIVVKVEKSAEFSAFPICVYEKSYEGLADSRHCFGVGMVDLYKLCASLELGHFEDTLRC